MIPLLSALLVGAGIAVAILARYAANQRRVSNLRSVLELQAMAPPKPEDSEQTSSLLARSGVVAERALGDAASLAKVRGILDQSDWSLTAGEFAVTTAIVALFAGIVGFFVSGFVVALIFAFVAGSIPYALMLRSVTKRRVAFEEQFPGVLDLIAASLESGASVVRALELVVEESDEPTASEFGRVLAATRMGSDLADALAAMSERLGSQDVDWTVQAITVQQRTGGKLAEILRIVARTMRGRAEVTRELQTLTVEGRMSAIILGALPFLIALVLLIVNPGYLKPLFHQSIGIVMVCIAGGLMAVGFVWMRRIVRVEV
jgi:tight adherence protein B